VKAQKEGEKKENHIVVVAKGWHVGGTYAKRNFFRRVAIDFPTKGRQVTTVSCQKAEADLGNRGACRQKGSGMTSTVLGEGLEECRSTSERKRRGIKEKHKRG